MTEKRDAICTALRSLANEASGFIGAFEAELRAVAGNTNVNCLLRRIDEARAVLEATTEEGR